MSKSKLESEYEYRVVIHPDCSPYEHGDYETEAQRKRVNASIELNGVWGYVLERHPITPIECVACGHVNDSWEHIDSCWSFIGTSTMLNDMQKHFDEFLPVSVDVPVYDGGLQIGHVHRKPRGKRSKL